MFFVEKLYIMWLTFISGQENIGMATYITSDMVCLHLMQFRKVVFLNPVGCIVGDLTIDVSETLMDQLGKHTGADMCGVVTFE